MSTAKSPAGPDLTPPEKPATAKPPAARPRPFDGSDADKVRLLALAGTRHEIIAAILGCNRAAVEQLIRTGDAFRTIDGQVITKRRAGDLYAMLKAQDAQLRATADALAKAHDRELATEFAKRATDIGCEPEFGATLRKAYAGDAAAASEVEQRIRALTAQVTTGELFTSFGHNQPAEGSATAEFMLKVDEVRKSHPNLSDHQAYARAYDNRANAEIVKRMRAEEAG